MPDVLEHIVRPQIPWRSPEQAKTECGRLLPSVGDRVITADAFAEKVRTQGQQRASMSTCMTCWSTAERHRYRRADWLNSPTEVLQREINWNGNPELDVELRALANLAAAHPEEFAALCSDDQLAAARQRRKTPRQHTRRL